MRAGAIATSTDIRRIVLPKSGMSVSRIGLGLAHVHLMTPPQRQQLIETALDLGITHFDTSHFYSDGLSERVLGAVLGTRRKDVTITTKFGLLGTPLIGRLGALAPVARKARSVAVRLHLHRYPQQRYTPGQLRRSLAASMRALRTDQVDVLAIHEPSGTAGLSDELIDALVAVRQSGQARFIGVSGDHIDDVVARWRDALDIIQTAEHRWEAARFTPDFTYSLFTGGRPARSAPLDQAAVDDRLRAALARRPQGAVIVQTRDPGRLARFVELAGE